HLNRSRPTSSISPGEYKAGCPTARDMRATTVVQQRISVEWDFPVVFTHGLFNADNSVLLDVLDRKNEHRRHRALVYIDANTSSAHPKLAGEVRAYFAARPERMILADDPQVVPGGEAIKNDFSLVDGFMRHMLARHMY